MAYDFNGTSDTIEASTGVVSGTSILTIACWFNSDSTTVNQTLVAIYASDGTSGYRIEAAGAAANDPVRIVARASNLETASGATGSYIANKWHHVCGIYSGTANRRCALDGLFGGTSVTVRNSATTQKTLIGAHISTTPANTQFANARIAEVGIWDINLTDDEAVALSKGAKPINVRPDRLVFYAPLVRDVSDYVEGVALTKNNPLVADHTRRYG